ncbi:MAG: type II toxin-antitoxin system RelB/DinJ family antitoxin [Treponema sp.]|uniref:type II toxin-antitoxin system RelB/DinJ family antitoxin n=1 Tax=Treponema sp. TaxID=166 RepID=UPI003FA1BF21
MARAANLSIRMDSDVKAQSEYVYNFLGLNLTTAINVFLRKSIQAGGFPFDVRLGSRSELF